jgi:hypothetical protein
MRAHAPRQVNSMITVVEASGVTYEHTAPLAREWASSL